MYPYWGWGPPGGYLPPLPPELKPRNGPAIAIAVVGVVVSIGLLAAAITVIVRSVDWDLVEIRAGECVQVRPEQPSGSESFLLAHERACESPDADFVVAVLRDDANRPCPEGDYRLHIHDGFPEGADLLCLIPNVAAGDCFSMSSNYPGRFSCDRGDRRFGIRVVRVVDGSADAPCAGSTALRYDVPPRTICFDRFDASG